MVREHVDRCVELYGNPIDAEFKRKIDLSLYEQMRADMMLCVGIIMAMEAGRRALEGANNGQ